MSNLRKYGYRFSSMLLCVLLLIACAPVATPTSVPTATMTALALPTATATQTSTLTPTIIPSPTATATPTRVPTPTINASTLLPCFTTGDPPVSYGCYIYTIAGGNFPDVGDGGPATQAVLERPDGILAAPDGSVYISDTWNNRVRRVRPDGIIETIAGTGSAETQTPGDGGPAKQANVRFPRGLALGSDGLLYIADTNFYKIRRIDRAGIINSVAGKNCCFFEGENVPATEASFVGPFAIAFDKQGNLYIADGPAHRVRRVGLDGKIRTMAGTGEAGNSGDGGAATNAKLNSPKSLAVDDRNRLLIASTFGGPIRRVDLDTGIISTLQGVSGYYVSIDAEGKIYVATGQQIFRVDPNSGATTLVAGTNRGGNSTGDNAPAAQATFAGTGPLSVDAQGNIYVIDIGGSRVRRIGKDGIITNFAGGGKMPGDNVPALEAIVYDTQGIGLDGAGNLFFNDFDHFTIRRLGLDGIVTTLAGDRFSSRPSDGGHPLQAYIQSPIGIVFDARGNLLFIDANNSIGAVRLIMPGADGVVDGSSDERIITVAGQIASRDQADHGKADGGPAKNAVFNAARDLAMDSKGNLYVADVFDNRVRKIVPGSDGVLTAALDEIITTFAGNGTESYTGDGGPATQAGIWCPFKLAIDSKDNVFVMQSCGSTSDTIVRRIDAATGVITTFLRSPGLWSLVFDQFDNLYFTNQTQIIRVDARTKTQNVVAGIDRAGYGGDGGDALKAMIAGRGWIATDKQGNVYLFDNGNFRIRKITFVPLK